jgi:hypothetical protein
MLDKLTIEDFKNRVDQPFTATTQDGRTIELKLAQVDALERPIEDKGREPFSLEFLAEDPHAAPQQTLGMEHEEMGAFPLFVVPLGPGEGGMRYEAIFT